MENVFYQTDRCLGSVCTINGKNAYSLFNADLREITPVAGKVIADFAKTLGSSSFRIMKHEFETGGIKLVFYVGGLRKEDCYINTSNLIAECKSCLIRTDEDCFEYVAVLTEYDVKETGVNYYNEVTLTFCAVKRLSMITQVFVGSGVFMNAGSAISGARIVITPASTLANFTINGITVKNMDKNVPFAIDGLLGEVKANGVNRFLDTDLIDFPKVYPGQNVIESSNSDCNIEISYYPTFIV